MNRIKNIDFKFSECKKKWGWRDLNPHGREANGF
jgi:hypothetical protein